MLSRSLVLAKKLWPSWADSRVERWPTRPPELLYAVEESPPPAVLVASAVQHVAVIAITLIFPLILGAEAGLNRVQLIDLVSWSMLAIGDSDDLLCLRSGLVGCGYLCPACYTAIFLGPSLFALQRGGLPLVFGMTIVSGLVQVVIAPILRRLRALMPSEIAGLVIAIVGLALAALGVRYMLGITARPNVEPSYLVISFLSLAAMTALNVWGRGYAKMFCVLIGMVVGYVASAALGVLDFSAAMPLDGLTILRLPHLDHIGYRFDPIVLAPFIVAAFASTLRVMGDVTKCQRLNDKDWVRPNFASLAAGVAGQRLGDDILRARRGRFGTNSYSSCDRAVGGDRNHQPRRRLRRRHPVHSAGAGSSGGRGLFAAMPKPVMGAALFFTAAFVFTSGHADDYRAHARLRARRIVIGFSFAMAVMADIYHNALHAGAGGAAADRRQLARARARFVRWR